MTFASFLSRRRRALALCAVSVGLHVAVLWWVAPRMGAAGALGGAPPRGVPVTIQARLLMAPVPAALVAPPPAPRPRPVRRPAAEGPAIVAPAARQGGAAEAVSDVQSNQPTTGGVDGPAIAMVAESGQGAGSLLEPQLKPQPQLQSLMPAAAGQYRVDLPPSATITLDVAHTDADGAVWAGEAVMSWQLDGDSYRMRVEAGVRVLVARINLVMLHSEGKVNEYGVAPVTLSEKRRGRAPTTTRFSERDGRITFSAAPGFTPAPVALLPGAQDKATLPLQLAAIARAGSGQIEAGVELLVGDERDASLYRFVVMGQEVLDTRLGKLQAWHLSRPPKPGAYSSRLDIWLAPGLGWYPVQIRNTEASGAVTTQTANKIVITDAGS